jgi:plastocyanin
MKNRSLVIVLSSVLALPVFLTGYLDGKDKKKPKNDACAASDPGSICSGPTTCGSRTSACEIDIRRIGQVSAAAKPNIANAKDNDAFCIKVGTTITFKSTSRDTGFVLDFGNSSPFDSGTAITGGADRPVSVVAKKPGCYTYTVGACTAGTVYGMCGEDAAQFIVSDR